MPGLTLDLCTRCCTSNNQETFEVEERHSESVRVDTGSKSVQGDAVAATGKHASEYTGDPCDLTDFEDLQGTKRLKNGVLGLVVTVRDCSVRDSGGSSVCDWSSV